MLADSRTRFDKLLRGGAVDDLGRSRDEDDLAKVDNSVDFDAEADLPGFYRLVGVPVELAVHDH